MHLKARRWASRSVLLDSLTPRWLTGGRKAKPRNTGNGQDSSQLALGAQTTDATKYGAAVDSPINVTALNEGGNVQTETACDAHGLVNNVHVLPSLTDSLSAIYGARNQSDEFAAPQRFAGERGLSSSGRDANTSGTKWSLHSTHAGAGFISADPLAPFLPNGPAQTASGRGSTTVASGSAASGKVVILESTPSAQAAAHESHFLAFGMPFGVCGCGYFTSPTRMLDWAQGGGMLQRDGQLPGTRLTEGPDYVPTGKGTIGASTSDPLPDRDLSPLSGWRGTARWTDTTARNGSIRD